MIKISRMPESINTLSGIINHRLVVNGHELFAHRARQRIEPRAAAARQDDALEGGCWGVGGEFHGMQKG